MKLKTLILLLLLGASGVLFYDYARTQFRQDAVAYKRFAKAVLEGDGTRVHSMIADNSVNDAFAAKAYRDEYIGGQPRLVYYTFLRRIPSDDGRQVDLTVRQTVRLDPPGYESFFGTETRQDQHQVTMVREGPAWKVKHFADGPTRRLRQVREHRR